MFPPLAELVMERARQRASLAGPIYRPSMAVPGGEIFLLATSIHFARSHLNPLRRFTIMCSCLRARPRKLSAYSWWVRRRGDHGASVDDDIVREENGGEECW